MADNYLENQFEKYAARKAAWEKKRKLRKVKKTSDKSRLVPAKAQADNVMMPADPHE